MNKESFQKRAAELAVQVDEQLAAFINSEAHIPNLHEGMLYSMGLDSADRAVRGKRIRPVLGLMTAEALGADPARAMAFACGIELLHNFALVHDDIEDGDTQRRGRPCVHVKYGLPHGINIGDFLFSKVFSVIVHDERNEMPVKERLMRLLTETLDSLFAGQALDISARTSRHFTVADYEDLVQKKTGSYLAAPMLGGAIVAGAGERTLKALKEYGLALGPMFQIRDDLIDLTSEKGRGENGNDIREGKRSFLVAALAEVCSDAERETMWAILDKPREQTKVADVEAMQAMFERHGVLGRAERECARLLDEGIRAIAGVPAELRQMLEIAAELLAKRST